MNIRVSLTPEALKVFETLPDLYLVLSPELVILTASEAYLKTMFTARAASIGRYLFDVFPDNPAVKEVRGVENLKASLQQVLATKKPHQLALQRYDVPRPDSSGNFEKKYLGFLNTPVLDGAGEIAYIILKVQEAESAQQSQSNRQSEELQRLKEALAIGHIGSFEWSYPDEIVYWSDEMYRIHGLQPSEQPITIDKVFQFTHPGDLDRLREVVIQAETVAGSYAITYRIIRPDGIVRHLKRSIQSWANATGRVSSLSGTVQDITEQQLAEAQLQEQANFIRQVTATVPDIISVIELVSGSIEYINQESLSASGFTYEGLTKKPPEERFNLIHPEDQPALVAYFTSFATATDQEVKTLEYRAKDYSVEWQWFLVRGRVFRRNENGEATHCLNVIQNITASKRAQAEISQHLQVLQQAEEVANMGSWEYDITSGAFQWSTGMYRLFGIEEGTGITPEIYLDYALPEDRPLAQKILHQLRTGQEPIEEVIRIKKDGQVRMLKVKARVMYDQEGNPVKVLGVDLDVTEVKQLEKENLELRLRQQKTLLLAILEAQEAERRIISESLHNGVGQILYAAKLQLDRVNLPESSLKEAKQKADQLLSEAIRETRHVSHELIPLLLEEQGLEVAIKDFFSRFAHTKIRFTFHGLKQRLEHHLEIAIYRIAQELVNNIVKHAQATKARIEVLREGNFILMEAQDDGIGMETTPSQGKGIGLKIIQDRVELLEGTLTIDSVPGKGTLITISLPLFNKGELFNSSVESSN